MFVIVCVYECFCAYMCVNVCVYVLVCARVCVCVCACDLGMGDAHHSLVSPIFVSEMMPCTCVGVNTLKFKNICFVFKITFL